MISPILSCFYQILNVRMMRTTRRTVKSTDWMTFATRTHMECTGTAPSLVDFAVSSLFHIDTAMLKAAVCFGFKTFQWIVVALICNEKHPSSKGILLWADNVILVSFFSLFYFWVLKSGKNSEKHTRNTCIAGPRACCYRYVSSSVPTDYAEASRMRGVVRNEIVAQVSFWKNEDNDVNCGINTNWNEDMIVAVVMAGLSRVRSVSSGAPWVRKWADLCIREHFQ